MDAAGARPALDDAWAAFRAGDWERACELFSHRLEAGPDPEALDGLGQALWFACEIDEAIARREEAYVQFRARGDAARAGRVALWLAIEYASSYGDSAVADGWFRRGERLLEALPACVEHVELEIQRARRAATPADAEARYRRALELARELGDADLEVRALSQLGIHRVNAGDADSGFALLDESMAAATGGELSDPWQIGGACCSMLAVCDQMADLDRAAQWCRQVVGFTRRHRYLPLFAWCRSAYAGVLIATGQWDLAEEELQASLRAYGGPGRPMAAYPLARLAELRMRQGRVEEAARLIAGLESHARAALVAIEIDLARGDTGAARAAIERRLGALPGDPPTALPLIALLVDAQLREDRLDEARDAARRLQALAARIGRDTAAAAADLGAGRVALAAGEPEATAHLETALARYVALGMPLDEARTRVDLARALGPESPARAHDELRRALATFEELGALADANLAAAQLREAAGTGRSAPRLEGELTAREREVLALLAEGLSNADIAQRLVVSRRTAEHHVARVLRKLGLRNRAEAAAYAVREAGG